MYFSNYEGHVKSVCIGAVEKNLPWTITTSHYNKNLHGWTSLPRSAKREHCLLLSFFSARSLGYNYITIYSSKKIQNTLQPSIHPN